MQVLEMNSDEGETFRKMIKSLADEITLKLPSEINSDVLEPLEELFAGMNLGAHP
jgi:hypothetical protein